MCSNLSIRLEENLHESLLEGFGAFLAASLNQGVASMFDCPFGGVEMHPTNNKNNKHVSVLFLIVILLLFYCLLTV